MEIGQLVRFVKPARGDEWERGETGKITSVLAMRPQATADIYLITLDRGDIVWATQEDIERSWGTQLTLC